MTSVTSAAVTSVAGEAAAPNALKGGATNDLKGNAPNDLEPCWLPFTPNRHFKRAPRLVSRARDMHYFKPDGTPVLDATAGLWCVNAGHCRSRIVEAIAAQAKELDFAPAFQYAHPRMFELAGRLTAMMPDGLDYAFFSNSGSEAVDSALKIALAYHHVRGQGQRIRLIGRERAYHGVGFGGVAVGGMGPVRKFFAAPMAGVDHLPHTYDRTRQAFTAGQPAWGGHLADDLERLVQLHDATTIAAVIVEPMAGSTGVLPPPVGYLERLREICTRHGILLIFDEVITAFGRLGCASAAERFGVTPDIMTFAKGVTSATVPLGGVLVGGHVYEAFQGGPDHAIDLFHGYTYSGHPLAVGAALATLDVYRDEDLFARARRLEPYWMEAVMRLKDAPHVADVRAIGLAAAFDLAPLAGTPGKRGYDVMCRAFHEHNLMTRVSADTIVFSPPLIMEKAQIDQAVEILGAVLEATDPA